MPIRYEWTPEQKQQAEAANQWLMDALSKVMPGSAYMGQEAYQPVAQPIANAIVPPTIEDAFNAAFNAIGVGPLELWANYRSPEAIKGLRKVMAQEQRARGPMAHVVQQEPLPFYEKVWPQRLLTEPDLNLGASQLRTDPSDLILRGSWFHGMSKSAREEVMNAAERVANIGERPYGWNNEDLARLFPTVGKDFAEGGYPFEGHTAMPLANQIGLPGSTHATPSYVRFGEPYGISLSASPAVSAKFSPDQMIHRVMPLYEGPPTERTLQLWKPEHQKRFNEAYNEAFNKWLIDSDINPVMVEHLKYRLDRNMPIETGNLMNDIIGVSSSKETGQFNTMFSDALKSQGVRGLLYNPRRYGEYEMLMLDPKWALPLDYRKSMDYIPKDYNKYLSPESPIFSMTPKARQGYQMADPEFAANHARLSDMFNLMPWTERINQDNWQRILEQVDSQYREAVINQLFRDR